MAKLNKTRLKRAAIRKAMCFMGSVGFFLEERGYPYLFGFRPQDAHLASEVYEQGWFRAAPNRAGRVVPRCCRFDTEVFVRRRVGRLTPTCFGGTPDL
jgi:hypothetical protein